MNRPGPIQILLVDDHALFREGVARALDAEPGFRVRHCGTIAEALGFMAEAPADVVLLDRDLGSERGAEFLPAARKTGSTARVLIVTAWVGDQEARKLIAAGAAGIFLKERPLDELADCIRTIAAGANCGDRPRLGGLADPGLPDGESAGRRFNERQRKVLGFVLEGLSNKEIAWRLQISESYVKAILQSLFHQTGVRTRGQLVRVALEQYAGQF